MAPKLSEILLPKLEEDKDDYVNRVMQFRASNKEDRVLSAACKAIATAWQELEMQNPFARKPMETPRTPREMMETTTILMAKAVSKVLPVFDEFRNVDSALEGSLKKHHRTGKEAVRISGQVKSQARHKSTQVLLTILSDLKGPFDAVMDLRENPEFENTSEKIVLDKLAPLYKEFVSIRRSIFESRRK